MCKKPLFPYQYYYHMSLAILNLPHKVMRHMKIHNTSSH
jgi:hypothetical protein